MEMDCWLNASRNYFFLFAICSMAVLCLVKNKKRNKTSYKDIIP